MQHAVFQHWIQHVVPNAEIQRTTSMIEECWLFNKLLYHNWRKWYFN